mmetsp:Transcript_22002/g.44984  ORF Transcript_22002/g.44984 Transcript_22002/m.44984 type:complete len:95 (+) Transcript_22002:249-533(+)
METRNPNVRSNNDSHQRFEQDGSQPQRSRQRLTQTKQSPPRVPVDTFIFSYCRGPRVIRNRGCTNNHIVGSTNENKQQRQFPKSRRKNKNYEEL